MREATLAPYGEFWVASADLRDGDLRMEFTGKTDDFDPATDEALLDGGLRDRDAAARHRRRAAQGIRPSRSTTRGGNAEPRKPEGGFPTAPYTATDDSPKQE